MDYKGTGEEILAAYDLEIKNVKIEQQRLDEKLRGLIKAREEAHNSLMISKSDLLAKEDWTKQKFGWSNKIEDILNSVFKLKSFRSKQLACINATLSGHDVILLMPTGGGKSLCYQLPALVTPGITLVISPLISLIEDQVMSLKKLNINAEMLNSNSSKELIKRVHDCLINGSTGLKLLYVTPERIAKSKRLMSCLQKCFLRKALDRIAIDEVHCCSQWGHDFRPDYKFLGVLKSMFPSVPIIGLTATATARILIDVQNMLDIAGCLVLKASFNRPNLYYEVRWKPSNQKDCVDILHDLLENKYRGKSGIIYTNTIKESIELVEQLRRTGLKVACYHADLEPETRSKIHSKWHSHAYQAVVATVAFGMGIDKPDVRFVIHHTLPKSMENFYQESGRAGRDNSQADCILFYKLADIFRISGMVFSNKTGLTNLYNMLDYCIDSNRCRRSIIAKYFEEVWEPCFCEKMCDHCRLPKTTKDIEISQHCLDIYKLLNHAASLDVRLTAAKLLDAWFQKGGDTKLRLKQLSLPSMSREFGENVLAYLLINQYLKEDFHFTAYSTISYIRRGPKAVLVSEPGHRIEMAVFDKVATSTKNAISNNKRKTKISVENKSKKVKEENKIFDLTDI